MYIREELVASRDRLTSGHFDYTHLGAMIVQGLIVQCDRVSVSNRFFRFFYVTYLVKVYTVAVLHSTIIS